MPVPECLYTFIKKESLGQLLPVNFAKCLKNAFITEHLQATASAKRSKTEKRFGVFLVNSENVSYFFVGSLLLTLNM